MKRLIFLKVEDHNPKDLKMKAAELEKTKSKVIAASIKSFRDGIKINKSIKIIQELPNLPQVIIEFPENQYHPVHNTLRSIKVVEIIDAILPLTEAQIKAKEKSKTKSETIDKISNDDLKKLKDKMAKYKK